jgi:HD-like signal output (HDOD) protein
MLEFVAAFADSALAACQRQFPRRCSACHRSIPSFVAHIDEHIAVGSPHFDDCDDEDDAVGVLCFANCICGSTLAVCYEDTQHHAAFNAAVRAQVARGLSLDAVLRALADEVHARARAASVPSSSASLSSLTATADSLTLEAGGMMMRLVANGDVSIPVYPAVAIKVRTAAMGDDVSLDTLVHLVSADAPLAAEMIRIANTAHYARGVSSTSLPAAVGRLGTRQVARTALSVAAGSLGAGPGPLAAVRTALWQRGVVTATIARDLAIERGIDADDAFLAGLLDILGPTAGAMSLERVLVQIPSFPPQPLRWWLRLFDVFRRQLGRVVIERWTLPASLRQTIAPAADDAPNPIAGVVADALVLTRLIEAGGPISLEHVASTVGLASITLITKLDGLATRCAAALSALQTPASTSPLSSSSSYVATPHIPTTPSADIEVVVDDGTAAVAFRAIAWDGEQVVVRGARLAVGGMIKVSITSPEGPVSLWATVRCVDYVDNVAHVAVLAPFAIDHALHQRLEAVLRC